ncbi:MAG: HAMP domain-containing sensor histidine kinase [Erysipelotrichaceae bacterium]|nr:HAMP domain-containing sensor histidine kinase [Erysipelotrichaceae bacterium]
MKSKISKKLILYFGSTLLVFTVIIGGIFLLVFRNYVLSDNEEKLKDKALTIATTISESSDQLRPTGGMGMLLRTLYGNGNEDVWVINSDYSIVTRRMGQQNSITFNQLPESAQQVVENVLGGETQLSEDFSSFLDGSSMTVATPLFDTSGKIAGAVLVHTQITGLNAGYQAAVWIMGLSLLFALAIAVVMGTFLSLSFSRPLNQMASMATELSEGNLTVRNRIEQEDEVGQLANNLNSLAIKLQQSDLQREQLNQIRKDFMATVSHELKTPLTVLQGSLEALMEKVAHRPDQIERYYQQMHDETLALSRLTDDLLELTRLSSSDFSIEKTAIALAGPLHSALEAAKIKGKSKNITWNVSLSDLSQIDADEGRIRQLLLILLDNAIKFSNPESAIDVSAKGNVVCICDHGHGIHPDDLPYIFDRFYRNKDAGFAGTGLGLAIAEQIAKRHDVNIEVTSQPHVQTCFTLTFTSN